MLRISQYEYFIYFQDGEQNKSVFSGFSGFNKPQSTPVSSAFSFLSNLTPNKPPEQPKVNGISNSQPLMFKSSDMDGTTNAEQDDSKLDEYYGKLKGLNESVLKWIQKHVDDNPFINLQPIFKDYDKYFGELEMLKSKLSSQGKAAKSDNTNSDTSKTTNASPFSSLVFKPPSSMPSEGSLSTASTSTATPDSNPPKPQFSFGSSTSSSTTGFTFKPSSTPSTPFSLGIPSTTSSSTVQNETKNQNEGNDEEDNPPKVEFTPVVEEGHVYTTRCKVFVKKEGTFTDRGVGNLFLKPVPNGEKFQLIVRADTNLGNLLCNFILSESIPTQRMGKKDVMLICLPMPDAKPPPTPILLRVKSPEDADKLLEVLEKHKK